jgi:hypothetical protein
VPASFIDDLPFPQEDRAKLASFGAASPFALLSIRKASREAFDKFIGQERVDSIARHLETMLTEQQRETLRQPARGAPGRLGARLGPLPRSRDGD